MNTTTLPTRVTITEVGPRDGLQNEAQQIPASIKIALCNRLLAAGVTSLEVTSFVSPKWVPQLADATQVMAGIVRTPGVRYSVLTPNMQGFVGALTSGANEIVIFSAASETFSHKNINCSIAESITRFIPVVQEARRNNLRIRAAVSCALGCPYEGAVAAEKVAEVVQRFADLGCDEIGIADTIGVGTAGQVQRVMEAAAGIVPLEHLSGHFHDTYGQALANVYASLAVGVHRFDASIAGLGGCPYAKGATGNVATEDLIYLLHGLGISTGIDLNAMVETGQWISQQLGRPSNARAGNAIAAKACR